MEWRSGSSDSVTTSEWVRESRYNTKRERERMIEGETGDGVRD